MAKAHPQITIEEISGEGFPSLGAAQRSARALLAADLAQTINHMIDCGTLEIVENKIKPKGK
jgi:hypothetical protein